MASPQNDEHVNHEAVNRKSSYKIGRTLDLVPSHNTFHVKNVPEMIERALGNRFIPLGGEILWSMECLMPYYFDDYLFR